MSREIAACQFEPVIGSLEDNYAAVREAALGLSETVSLAVFPELCLTGYDLEIAEDEAKSIPGPATDRLVDIAAAAELTLVVGLPERDGDTIYNDLVCVSGDGVEGRYRKQYLWGDEAEVFTPSDGPTTVDTSAGTVGFLLCYDLNFPETALAYAECEVDILAVSAAWRKSYHLDWELLLRTRALDTTCYAVGANHAGDQRDRQHHGRSLITGPTGTVLNQTTDNEGSVTATVEPETLTAARKRNPVSKTRRKNSR